MGLLQCLDRGRRAGGSRSSHCTAWGPGCQGQACHTSLGGSRTGHTGTCFRVDLHRAVLSGYSPVHASLGGSPTGHTGTCFRVDLHRAALSGYSPVHASLGGSPTGHTGTCFRVDLKFADDTKLFRVVKTRSDCEELQKDLSRLAEWAAKWQMRFNVAMKDLWGEGLHQAEMEDMMKEKATTKTAKNLGVLDLMKARSLRKPLYVTVLLIMSLQLCGLTAIYFYTIEVFRTAKLEEALIPYVALGLGTSEFISVILCSSIIDRFGRKILLWGGFGLMAMVMALLVVTLSLQDLFPWMSYCSITLIFLFVSFYGLGPSGAIFAVLLEIFNQSARASAFIITGIISWVGLFMNGMCFPFIVEALGQFCFFIFLAVLTGAAVFVYTVLPETKGKSIADITEEFSRMQLRKKGTQEENSPWKDHSPCTKL
ncbi:solute carrier family 2, facilitated glucose transporter member 9-like isoform X2 [Tiliqua scincoides]|uniref:solute carrier family 2, facilitated glucose transporter member 9-like isoform X2 n=1 Tax=Tiliqua scincoides TaxID=71010 RepID=UPI003461A3DA